MQRGFLVEGDVVEVQVKGLEDGHTDLVRIYHVIDDEVCAYPENISFPWMKDICTYTLDDVKNVIIGLTPLFPMQYQPITKYVR
ncbi:MAG: hypothetical protein NT120_00780 [Candidatus Aenigmarchaeota archaeon]|nr:hypothetical protein [Candidatus Aenigmarchaeota archaeon]